MSHVGAADYSQPTYEPSAAVDPYPQSEEEWRELYLWRWKQYLMHPYSAGDQKREHLFRAFDDSGNEIDQTRRLFRFYGFVVDTDARALTGGGLTLETHDRRPGQSKPSQLLAGELVWRRSRLATQLPVWSRMTCALGDWWIEPVRTSRARPYRTTLAGYNPQIVRATYDVETGTRLERVEIDFQYLDSALGESVTTGGLSTFRNYRRILTATRVEVWLDGKLDEAQSGDHNLGVVPIVHMQAMPWDQPEHSLPAPFGIERALMKLDSYATQLGAIGNRFGNPTLVTYGYKLGASSDVQRFGRMIDGAPADGRTEYLEAGADAMASMLASWREIIAHVRDVTPEFLFASDAAQESAAARSLRGQAFEAKMLEMREINFAALAEVTAMAVAMDAGQPYDDEEQPFRIDAPPIMPRHVGTEIEGLLLVRDAIKRADFTRHLQRLGIIGNDQDPEAYTREVADEQAERTTAFFADPVDSESLVAAAANAAAGEPG